MAEPTTRAPVPVIPGIEELEPIGRGGFATVYQGWQTELHRAVAVKVLHASTAEPGAEARFRREIRTMGSLSDHPHVVPVYATGMIGDRPYLVMPLLPGGSLADRLADGPLPPAEVVSLGRGLADALATAHASGVLHRDVKPANVLCTAYGTAQLGDFGIARFVDSTSTSLGMLNATVVYAAPEVLAGDPATEASDVYSLGATLHAACRGRPPFERGEDELPVALAVRVMTTSAPELRSAGVPRAVADVVERAMAHAPADRYPSAADLRDALDAVSLEPEPPTERLPLLPPSGETTTVVPAAVIGTPPVAPVAPAATRERVHEVEREPGRKRTAVLALVAGIVALAAATLLLADRDGGELDDGLAVVPTSVATTAPATTTTTAAPTTTTPPTTAAAALPTDEADAVRSYYALMSEGRIDEGFARLSPEYQRRTGEDEYREFWETIADVEVLEVDTHRRRADATLRYTRVDGSTSTEDVTLKFVEDRDTGALLIDDYDVH